MRNEELAKKYPNLFISINNGHWGVWTFKDGRDGDAICYHELTDAELVELNKEVEKAIQPNWFFCKSCGKAHPMSDYQTFNMAARYCKDCCAKDPSIEARASAMTYD